MTWSKAQATCVTPGVASRASSERRSPRVAPTARPSGAAAGGAPKCARNSSYVPSTRWTFNDRPRRVTARPRSELLVRGGAVGAGHRRVQQAQVDGELAAVVDQVVQGEVAQRGRARLLEAHPPLQLEAPRRFQRGVRGLVEGAP